MNALKTAVPPAPTFTPGPWIAKGSYIRGTDSGRYPSGHEYIAHVRTEWMDSPFDRKPANAALIAAAPDLLASLKHLRTIIDRSAPYLAGMMEYQAACAAIAKAECPQ